jgi:hypothetical protein
MRGCAQEASDGFPLLREARLEALQDRGEVSVALLLSGSARGQPLQVEPFVQLGEGRVGGALEAAHGGVGNVAQACGFHLVSQRQLGAALGDGAGNLWRNETHSGQARDVEWGTLVGRLEGLGICHISHGAKAFPADGICRVPVR